MTVLASIADGHLISGIDKLLPEGSPLDEFIHHWLGANESSTTRICSIDCGPPCPSDSTTFKRLAGHS